MKNESLYEENASSNFYIFPTEKEKAQHTAGP